MKKIVILLGILIFVSNLFSQRGGKRISRYGFEVDVKPPIYYDLIITHGHEDLKPLINFVIKVQYDILFFTKTDDGYRSGYDIAISIMDDKTNSTVYSQLWNEEIIEKDFDLTNSLKHYHVNSRSFALDIPAGEYKIFIEFTDKTSKNVHKSNRKFSIHDISTSVSDFKIKLISPEDSLSSEIVTEDDQISVEFNEDLLVHLELILADPESLSISSELLYLAPDSNSVVKSNKYDLMPEDNHYLFEELIEKKYLEEGDYSLSYKISFGDKIHKIKKNFSVVWYSKPVYLYEAGLAIRPMRYILTPDEREYTDDLSDDELKKWFEQYWKKKDPDPNTPLNEILLEFYQRVMRSNKKYPAQYLEGWETDRGKALILYGDPDRVDSRRYLTNTKPYEVWFYDSLNKKLVFVDVNEDKSYRLMSVEDIGEKNNE
jgi:GWxTD domain-containing protein